MNGGIIRTETGKREKPLAYSPSRVRLVCQRAADFLFLLAYALLLCRYFLISTTFRIDWPPRMYEWLRFFAVATACIRLAAYWESSLKWHALSLAALAVFVIAWRVSTYQELIDLGVLIVGMRGIPAHKVLKAFCAALASLLLVVILLSLRGVIINLRYVQDDGGVRNSFGICYPTDFSAYVLFLTLAWFAYREEKATYWELLAAAIVALAAYRFTNARTSLLCMLLAVGAFTVNRLLFDLRRFRIARGTRSILTWICVPALIFCAVLTGWAVARYNFVNPDMIRLDEVFNSRLLYSKKAFLEYGFKLWGQYVHMLGSGGTTLEHEAGYYFLDSAIISIPVRYGVMVAAVFLTGFVTLSMRAAENRKYSLVFALAVLAVNAIVEHHMPEINYNPFLMLLFAQVGAEAGPMPLRRRLVVPQEERRRHAGARRIAAWILMGVYVICSGLLLWRDTHVVEYQAYDMWVRADESSEDLTEEFAYQQVFSAPVRFDGIQLFIKTHGLKPLANLLVTIGDAETGEVIGTETADYRDIPISGYVKVPFTGFRLEEGGRYYVTIARQDVQQGSIGDLVLGLGQSSSPYLGELTLRGEAVSGMRAAMDPLYKLNGRGLVGWMFLTAAAAVTAALMSCRGRENRMRRLRNAAILAAFIAAYVLLYALLVNF